MNVAAELEVQFGIDGAVVDCARGDEPRGGRCLTRRQQQQETENEAVDARMILCFVEHLSG